LILEPPGGLCHRPSCDPGAGWSGPGGSRTVPARCDPAHRGHLPG